MNGFLGKIMTENFQDIWHNANLWPANSISVYNKIQRAQADVENGGDNDNITTYAISPYSTNKIRQSDEWKTNCIATLNSLCLNPQESMARSAFKELSAGYLSPFGSAETWDKLNAGISQWREPKFDNVITSFLQYIIKYAPDVIAVHNSMFFLYYLDVSIDANVIAILGLNTNKCLADRACALTNKIQPKSAEKERLIFSLAQAGSSVSRDIVLENTTRKSDRDIKDWILEILFADPWPHGYVIDDYIDYIEHYIDKGDLLAALNDSEPEPKLLSGTLEVFTHVVRGLGSDWDNYYEEEEEAEIFIRLIEHLKDRELSIIELEHLSDIYINPIGLGNRDKNDGIARRIIRVFKFSPNKHKIDEALVSTDNNDFYTAFQIIKNIHGSEQFEIIFEAIKNANDYRFIEELVECVTNKDQASLVIEWAISRFRISDYGYSSLGGSGYNDVLKGLIEVAGDYPGVGGSLILAGFEYGTTAHDQAAKALLKWDLKYWPKNADSHLNQAIKNTERTHDLLTKAKKILSDSN